MPPSRAAAGHKPATALEPSVPHTIFLCFSQRGIGYVSACGQLGCGAWGRGLVVPASSRFFSFLLTVARQADEHTGHSCVRAPSQLL
jgi:hypothetical protein